MTRLWQQGEPITVTLNRHQQPIRLAWRRHTYTIQRIQQQWSVDVDWWDERGQIQRVYFAITTTSGLLCVIFYDQLEEAWLLNKIYD